MGSQPTKVRARSSTGLQLRRLPVQHGKRFGPAHSRKVGRPEHQNRESVKGENYTVRQFMSLIGLFTAPEKQVPSGYLHMRPIQWQTGMCQSA